MSVGTHKPYVGHGHVHEGNRDWQAKLFGGIPARCLVVVPLQKKEAPPPHLPKPNAVLLGI